MGYRRSVDELDNNVEFGSENSSTVEFVDRGEATLVA